MHSLAALLASWGYVILAASVVAEQVPLPVPAVPVLLGIGALAADGRMSIVAALVIACAASLPMDLLWRRLGAVRGTRALRHMTRLSLEPASRVRRIQTFFERYGNRVLLIAKFVPGLTVLAPALAGLIKVPLTQFLILDIAGVLLWAGTWMSLGYLFGRAPGLIVAQTTFAGNLLAGLATAFVIYVLLRTVRRQRWARHFRLSSAVRPLLGRLRARLASVFRRKDRAVSVERVPHF
jgi:membrane protein DedA with SNARE-associated domain